MSKSYSEENRSRLMKIRSDLSGHQDRTLRVYRAIKEYIPHEIERSKKGINNLSKMEANFDLEPIRQHLLQELPKKTVNKMLGYRKKEIAERNGELFVREYDVPGDVCYVLNLGMAHCISTLEFFLREQYKILKEMVNLPTLPKYLKCKSPDKWTFGDAINVYKELGIWGECYRVTGGQAMFSRAKRLSAIRKDILHHSKLPITTDIQFIGEAYYMVFMMDTVWQAIHKIFDVKPLFEIRVLNKLQDEETQTNEPPSTR